MDTMLYVGLLICGLVAAAKADCMAMCGAECDTLTTYCKDDTKMILYQGSCSNFGNNCKNICKSIFCPCLAKAEDACGRNKNVCKGQNGKIDYKSILQVNICVAPKSALCFAQAFNSSQTDLIERLQKNLNN